MIRLPRDHAPLVAPNIICVAPGCRTRTGGFHVFCGAHSAMPIRDRNIWLVAHLRADRLRRKQRSEDAELIVEHLSTDAGRETQHQIAVALGRPPVVVDSDL